MYSTEKGVAHKSFSNTDEAIRWAQHRGKDTDVWFAYHLFNTSKRKKEFSLGANGFAIDLDVGADEHKYSSKKEAYADLRRWCQTQRVPRPTIVDSGNGIHAYWLCDEFIEKDDWGQIARSIKSSLTLGNVKQDPAVTADSARVMRVPGTFNHKDPSNPKPVKVLKESTPLPRSFFDKKFPARKVDNSRFSAKSAQIDPNMEYSGELIANQCNVIAHVAKSEGNVEEPLWYQALGVAAYCKDSSALAHAWSKGHPQYSFEETEAKLARRKADAGPPLCETLRSYAPDKCAGCPLADKIRTPMSAGRIGKVEKTQDEVTLNNRWHVASKSVSKIVEGDVPKKILSTRLVIDRLGRGAEGGACAFMQWRTPAGTLHKGELLLSLLSSKKELSAWLLDQGIIVDERNIGNVVDYLKDFAQSLQQKKDPELIAEQFGWTKDGAFLLGNDKFSLDGRSAVTISPKIQDDIRQSLKPQGSLEDWAQATELLSDPELQPHAFAVLASFATPVFNIMGVQGAVLSLAGQSGSGKTAAISFALSAWGDPKRLISSPGDTQVSRDVRMKTYNNIPLAIDDLSGSHFRSPHLKNLVYQAANGQARNAGTSDGGLRTQATWQLLLMLSTNNPLMDQRNYLQEAEKRRLIELSVNHAISPETGKVLARTAGATYGVAGRAFLKALIANREKVAKRTEALSDQWLADPKIPEANRFGVWLCAAAMVAGKLAHRKGIIRFDPQPVVGAVVDQLRRTGETMLSPVELVNDAIAAFTDARQHNINWYDGTETKVQPNQAILARYDFTQKMLFIPSAQLRLWLDECELATSLLTVWAENAKIQRKKVRLGKGSAGPVHAYCIPIELDTPEPQE